MAALAAAGERPRAYKPVLISASTEPPEGTGPPDHVLLGAVSGMDPDEVAPLRFGVAASPHLAAELAGARVDPDAACGGRAGGRRHLR